MDSTDLSWPTLDEGYTDELGVIAPEVYQVAGELWPQARQKALSMLGDEQAGHTLLLKAAAQVTQRWRERPAEVANLRAYLSQAFKHLVWAECKKELRRHAQSGPVKEGLPANPFATAKQIDNYLAIQQAKQKMDAWTREVFELLQLGHSYEEIATMLGTRAVLVRVKFHKCIKRLCRQLQAR
jgi:DNA-directed RNA polymerase specialized sigma24 family protein